MDIQIPETGISYKAVRDLIVPADADAKARAKAMIEAIATVNALVVKGTIRFDRIENGQVFWVREEPEPFAPIETNYRATHTCQRCGKKFESTQRGKNYCSSRCNSAREREARKAERTEGKVTFICAVCGKKFDDFRNRITCSRACSNRLPKKEVKPHLRKKRNALKKWGPCIVCGIDHNNNGPTCPSRKCRNAYLGVTE